VQKSLYRTDVTGQLEKTVRKAGQEREGSAPEHDSFDRQLEHTQPGRDNCYRTAMTAESEKRHLEN
jgi:hypothetical protein